MAFEKNAVEYTGAGEKSIDRHGDVIINKER